MHTLSFMVTKYKEDNNWVLYNWFNTANVVIDDVKHPLYEILESNTKQFSPFSYEGSTSDFDYLVDEKFIVTDQEEVRNAVRGIYSTMIDKKRLSITLLPVGQECNFNCIYCSQQHHKEVRMGTKDIEVLRRFILQQKVETLRIDYFGGEPLLNPDFIFQCNNMAIELSDKERFDFIGSSITTNGYLLDEALFLKLISHRINSYQITLDGLPELHDTLRPLSNGAATFDVIYKNLVDITQIDPAINFSITLRVNFNYDTLADPHRVAFIEKMQPFMRDKRFIVMPAAIENWKNEKKTNLYCDNNEKIFLQMKFEDEFEKLGFYMVGTILFAEPGAHSCYCSKPNNFVIFPFSDILNGMKVQKCTRDPELKENNIGKISESGELIYNNNIEIWVKNALFKEKKCEDCFLVLHCFSNSCPHNNWEKKEMVCPPVKSHEKYFARRMVQFISEHS